MYECACRRACLCAHDDCEENGNGGPALSAALAGTWGPAAIRNAFVDKLWGGGVQPPPQFLGSKVVGFPQLEFQQQFDKCSLLTSVAFDLWSAGGFTERVGVGVDTKLNDGWRNLWRQRNPNWPTRKKYFGAEKAASQGWT